MQILFASSTAVSFPGENFNDIGATVCQPDRSNFRRASPQSVPQAVEVSLVAKVLNHRELAVQTLRLKHNAGSASH
jgi:hypothetical protein